METYKWEYCFACGMSHLFVWVEAKKAWQCLNCHALKTMIVEERKDEKNAEERA